MTFTKKNESAVSPVIGTILMVSICVILAAIIAAFVFGMSGNMQTTKLVSLNVERTGSSTITATFYSSQDIASLTNVSITINEAPATGTFHGNPIVDGVIPESGGAITVGDIAFIDNAASVGNDRVLVVGTFNDGTSQVIVDKTL